jgi:hypothetical protein
MCGQDSTVLQEESAFLFSARELQFRYVVLLEKLMSAINLVSFTTSVNGGKEEPQLYT